MLASKMLVATLKEAPSEAQIASHILLIRAGMIRKLVSGVYNYLPLGVKVLNKVENIIREEMDNAGSLEILSSAIQPKELWEESGRWSKYGPELMRFKDRHDREFCLGPTHEEIFTDLVRNELKSRKSFPINLYQIQTKYRDELRPRFGLMRGREFIMKDAYSFDTSEEGLDVSYNIMMQAYKNVFDRLAINYQVVLADTGAIGGNASHQFMALSEVGESNILYCNCGYAADQEKAYSNPVGFNTEEAVKDLTKVETPNQKTMEEVCSFTNVDKKQSCKAVVYYDLLNERCVCVFVRGDRDVNLIKVINKLGLAEHEIKFASDNDLLREGLVEGFIGPINNKSVCLIDEELTLTPNLLCGANEVNYHFINANYNRDFTGIVGDFRMVEDQDLCPICHKPLTLERGIEVGQIFKLGTKYSKPMNATFTDVDGSFKPLVMGCYGIGVTRTLSSIIEQHHDDAGIVWPLNVAPYHAVIIPINYADSDMKSLADKLYAELTKAHVEVVLDDRDAKPGFKFKDWELIGIPYQIIVGRGAKDNIVEFKVREGLVKTEEQAEVALSKVIEAVKNL